MQVSISIPPDFINESNCSLCGKHGAWWGYFGVSQVRVEGRTSNYVRADYSEPAVEVHFCLKCGCTTHWLLTESFKAKHSDQTDRMGVNMRLFNADDLKGIELRFPDGRNWDGKGEYGYARDSNVLGSQ